MKSQYLAIRIKKQLQEHKILSDDNLPMNLSLTDEHIRLFAEEMRKEKPQKHPREKLIYKFLFQDMPDDMLVEEMDIQFETMSHITYVAIKNVVDEFYTINKTYANKNESQPISEFLVDIEYNQKVSCFNNGMLELYNKETNGKLTLTVESTYDGPKGSAYSIKDSHESRIFLDRIALEIKNNNLYKNKKLLLNYGHNGLKVRFIKPNNVSLDKVIISDEIKDIIKENVFNTFQMSEIYKQHGIPLKRGVLLEGDPGNGKSTLIKYLETSLDKQVTVIYSSDSIFSYSEGVQALYNFANKNAPSLVVIEDIDSIARSREGGGGTNFCTT